MIRCVSDSLSLSRIGSAFWTHTRSLFYSVLRPWISESSKTYILKLRFGHVLKQSDSFGRRNRPRFEATF